MRRLRILIALTALCFGLTAVAPVQAPYGGFAGVISVGTAYAQQAKKKKRRSLFSILFGRKKVKKKATVKRRAKRRKSAKRSTKRRRKRSATRIAKVPAIAKVEKLENAKKVLVVGDFLAGGLADGLTKRLADVASVVVVDKARGLSGFVRDDVVNWPVELKSMIDEFKPSYVVAMLGTNDRQQIKVDGRRYNKRVPEWDVAYKQRVTALGTVLKESGLPFSWVGLPPVRFKNMSKDLLFFNETYAKAAESENGSFIDVWDGFSDADGNYSRSGPDVNGQIVLLRPKGGINLTKAGKERLAYYVEGPILRVLGGRDGLALATTGVQVPGVQLPKAVEYDPAKTGRTVVIRLDDPSADGDKVLAGESVTASTSTEKPLVVPVLNTSSPSTRREGRINNYTWPPVANGLPSTTPPVASTN